MIKLNYIAAKMAFNQITAIEIQNIVDGLLNDSVYADEFLDIIDIKNPSLADVLPPFSKFLEKQGIDVPNKDEAVWQIIEHHIENILNGVSDPLESLCSLIKDVYWDYDFHTPTKEYLGDSHAIQDLIGLYWGYDDMKERPNEISCNNKFGVEGIAELKKEILISAKEWKEKFDNRVAGGFSPPAPTTPGMRVRTRRFTKTTGP